MSGNNNGMSNNSAASNHQKSESDLTVQLRQAIWWMGIPAWLFSLADRSIAALSDGYFVWDEGLTVFAIAFLLLSWLSLRPQQSFHSSSHTDIDHQTDIPFNFQPAAIHTEITQKRMAELHPYHLISQSYILPFPYLAQIYHLLNLKHLETIHSFSLNNLRVLSVSSLEQTEQGGIVKFQTALDSAWNVLRIWRQMIAEVQLTLHTPYTVELTIPVYGDKAITVIFNTLPLKHMEHQFSVDIYSNLQWYKPVIKALLHFSTILTLLEDIPYLEALTRRVQHLGHSEKLSREKAFQEKSLHENSNHEMMWLFNRFVGLYGTESNAPKLASSEAGL
jgi:hypothetical protein